MNDILLIEQNGILVGRAALGATGALTLEKVDVSCRASVEALLAKINTTGPELRQCLEDTKAHRLIETLVVVKPGAVNYGYAIEDEFTRAGFFAKLLDVRRAELWEKVRASDTAPAFQETVLRHITLFKDDLVGDIAKEFEAYQAKAQ